MHASNKVIRRLVGNTESSIISRCVHITDSRKGPLTMYHIDATFYLRPTTSRPQSTVNENQTDTHVDHQHVMYILPIQ